MCSERDRWGGAIWKCLCDCGKIKAIPARYFTRKDSNVISCGCVRRKHASELSKKYPLNNYKHGYSSHPLYRVWAGIKRRCYLVNDKSYPYYGKRGITLSKEWQDPESFVNWGLSHGWKKGLCLDRLDSSLGYSPNNCRFISRTLNSKRTARARKIVTLLANDPKKICN